MSQNYINQIKFNNGIRPAGNFPLDDRTLWTSIEDFFITEAESKNPRDLIDSTESMYNKVYKGMTVKLLVSDDEREEYNLIGDVVSFTCINDEPYRPDTCKEVNKENFFEFWVEDGRGVFDEVQDHDEHLGKVDTSVSNLETYAQAVNVTEATNGAVNIKVTEETAGAKGKKYELSVKVDNDSVKIINDKITGGKYKFSQVTPSNDNITASYQLAYKAPGAANYTNLTDCTIDIAKDYVIKSVHYCKATVANGKYTETAKAGDSNWETAAGKVYLHIIWHTKEEDDHITETWINIGELIALDLADINASIERLNTSVNTLHDYVFDTVNDSIINLGKDIKALDASANKHLDSSITLIQADIKNLNTSANEHINASINALRAVVDQNMSDSSLAISNALATAKTLIEALDASANTHINSSVAALETSIDNLNASTLTNINGVKSTIDTIINPSIDDLTAYVQAVNVSNAGGVVVGNSASAFDCKGKKYTVKVNVDDDTIKIVNDKVTGGKYKFSKISANTGCFASYQLAYKAPNSDTYNNLTDCTIDIPKDFVVKEVHYCKAVIEGGKYKETARDTDTNWATAAGDVYLHFIWATKSDGDKVDETWLKVADFINLDLKEINAAIAKLQSDLTALDTSITAHLNASALALETAITALNTSTNSHINASVALLEQTINNKVAALDTSVNNHMNASIAAVNAHIDSSYVALDTKITKNINDLSTLLSSNLQTQITANKNSITLLDSSLTALKQEVVDNELTVTNSFLDVNTRIKSLDSSVARHIDSSVAEINETILENELINSNAWTDLDSRLKAAIARITALENQLNS